MLKSITVADPERPRRQREAGRAGQHGDQQPLGQELPDDASAAGAERQAHGDLALPGDGAREHDVRHVGARRDEHEHERGEHRGEDREELERQRVGRRRAAGPRRAGRRCVRLAALDDRVAMSGVSAPSAWAAVTPARSRTVTSMRRDWFAPEDVGPDELGVGGQRDPHVRG